MYISSLSIENYRNFDQFTIKLKPLTLIIGENNVGKSNLLDSIGLLFSQDVSFFKKRTLELADFNYGTIRKFKKAVLDNNIPAEKIDYPVIKVEATLSDWNPEQESVIGEWFSNRECTEARLCYVFAPFSKFNKIEEIEHQRKFIADYEKKIGKAEFDQLPENAKLDLLNFPIAKYHYTIYGGRNADTQANSYHLAQLRFELLDALRDACSELVASHNNKLLFRILNSRDENEYQELKTELLGLQDKIDRNTTLKNIKDSISTQLDKISLVTDTQSNLVELIFSIPDVADILKKISLIYGDNPVKIERNGTGRNNLLFISLVLSFIEDTKKAQSAYFRVVGIEEPEAHLHPNLQDHLAHNIEKLIKGNDGKFRKDIQLLITSHSTHVTTKIDFENTVVLYKLNGKITSHYILDGFDEKAKAKKQIQYLNKYLDAVNTNIFYSPKIILVEGISEKLLIPAFFEKITKHSTERSGCCVVNVNGLAFSNFLEIIKNGYFQKCLVLTDKDSDTNQENRAESLEADYSKITCIKVSPSGESTFEKDLIAANLNGKGKTILLNALKMTRPTAGKIYADDHQQKTIDIPGFFELIKNYKSSFAYSLSLELAENMDGFSIPQYIVKGIAFILQDETETSES
jgi:putative ATP-dependent endonuclease of OLD family